MKTCGSGDPKGFDQRTMTGELDNFTGVTAPYEPPANPDLTIRSDQLTPEQSALMIIEQLNQRGRISN